MLSCSYTAPLLGILELYEWLALIQHDLEVVYARTVISGVKFTMITIVSEVKP